MDSLDLFKKLTTNLSFSQSQSKSSLTLKRKLQESNNDFSNENVKRKSAENSKVKENNPNLEPNKSGKKKNLTKINEEKVN